MATENVGGVEYSVDFDTSQAISSTKRIETQTSKIEKSFKGLDTQVTKTSKAVKNGLSGVGRGAGQAGIQFQQFIGQVQGGQSAMLALSQQSADLGFVLGAPLLGAVIGIGASLIGILAPSFFKTSEAAKEFKFEVAEVSKELKNLQDLSKAQVAVAIDNTNKSMGELSKEAKTVGDRIAVLNQTLDAGEKANVRITKTGRAVIENKKLTKKETSELTKELAQEQANLDKINQQYLKESDLLVKLTKNKTGYKKETQEQKDNVNDLEQSLKAQVIALEQGEEAAFRYATAQQLGLKVGEQIPANIDEQISAIFRLKQAQADAAEQKRKDDSDARKAASGAKQLSSQASGVADRFGDPIATLEAQKSKELEILRNAEEKGLQLHSDYATLRANIDQQYAEKERLLREQKFIEESKANELAISSIDALGDATTNTLSGLLSGTYSATEAMQQFANTILNNAVGALVDVGVQYVKNAIISETADKAMLASKTATQATQAAVHTAAVTASVAELTSLASAGAFAATAAIPLVGPALAPAAAVAAGAATAALGAPAIAAAPIAGARFNGGDVSGGSMYEVGEKNRPEMLMIPGNNGKVFSNAEMKQAMSGGGSQPVNVNIINNAHGVSVIDRGSSNDGVTRTQVLEIIAQQSGQVGSKMNQNINKNHNVTNRQGTNRRN